MKEQPGILHLQVHPTRTARKKNDEARLRSCIRRLFAESAERYGAGTLNGFEITNGKVVDDKTAVLRVVHAKIADADDLPDGKLVSDYEALNCCSSAKHEGGHGAGRGQFAKETRIPRDWIRTEKEAALRGLDKVEFVNAEMAYEKGTGDFVGLSPMVPLPTMPAPSGPVDHEIVLEMPDHGNSMNEHTLLDALTRIGIDIARLKDVHDPLWQLGISDAVVRRRDGKPPEVRIKVSPDRAVATGYRLHPKARFRIAPIPRFEIKWRSGEWSPSSQVLVRAVTESSARVNRRTSKGSIDGLPRAVGQDVAPAKSRYGFSIGLSRTGTSIGISVLSTIAAVVLVTHFAFDVIVTIAMLAMMYMICRISWKTLRTGTSRPAIERPIVEEGEWRQTEDASAWNEIAALVDRHGPELADRLALARDQCLFLQDQHLDTLNLDVKSTLAMVNGDVPELLERGRRPLMMSSPDEAKEIVRSMVSALSLIGERAEEARETLRREASIGFDDHVKYISDRVHPLGIDKDRPAE